jgi:hypothetical protein
MPGQRKTPIISGASKLDAPRAGNGAEREEQRDHVEPDDAALFPFAIDDVERIEDRLHPGIGAPQRHQKSEYKGQCQLAVAILNNARDLVAE